MTLQYSVTVRNAKLDAVETTVGAAAIMKIFTGAPPADCSQADSGTVLAILNLPSDWMAAAVSGQKEMNGTWEDTAADAGGTAGHFRIYDSGGSTCHAQGSITATGGGGDMEVDNTNFAAGQHFQVTSFTITAGNA